MDDLFTIDDITCDRLTAILGQAGVLTHGRVLDCRFEAVTGVPSFTGSFARLDLSYDRRPPGAPTTIMAKSSIADHVVREAVHSMGFYQREALFYRELAGATPVPVPRCFYARVDPADGRSLLLLEDLTAARQGRSVDAMPAADVELAVDTVARLHARWWGSADLDRHALLDPDAIMPAGMSGIFLQHWRSFLAKLAGPISEDTLWLGKTIARQLESSLRELFHGPALTLIHHDYQADNLVFDVDRPDGSLCVIDWQLPVRGRGVVDLAYLLSGSLDPEQRARTETDLLSRYVSRLTHHGVNGYSRERALLDYRRALLIPPARLALAVASNPSLTAHPGAFWEVLFERQLRAVQDNF